MHTQQRNPLANVVVKLAGDSGLLFLVRFDQLLTVARAASASFRSVMSTLVPM